MLLDNWVVTLRKIKFNLYLTVYAWINSKSKIKDLRIKIKLRNIFVYLGYVEIVTLQIWGWGMDRGWNSQGTLLGKENLDI